MFQIQFSRKCEDGHGSDWKCYSQNSGYETLIEAQRIFMGCQILPGAYRILDLETLVVHPVRAVSVEDKSAVFRFRAGDCVSGTMGWEKREPKTPANPWSWEHDLKLADLNARVSELADLLGKIRDEGIR